MKFYQVDTDDGPQLVTRKDVAKKLDPKFRPVDIPTDSEGLRTHINQLMAIKHARELDPAPEPTMSVPIVEARLAPGRKPPYQASKMFEHDDIVEIILESESFQLTNYFDAVMERAKRLKKEFDDAVTASRKPAAARSVQQGT